MKNFLDLLTQIITTDIFIGFGFYSIIYVLIAAVAKEVDLVDIVDRSSVRFIIFSGVVYFLAIVIWVVISIMYEGPITLRGRYWWAPWMQPLLWIALTQFFWIKKIRTTKLLRLIIAIPFILSFERYVILVTSLHRDYAPASWTIFSWISPFEIIVGLATKVILFCVLAIVYSFVIDRIRIIVKP